MWMNVRRASVLVVLVLSCAALWENPSGSTAELKAGDWSGFRGPTGMGTSAAQGLPLEWSATENIVWKAALPGPGASSPIVWQDRVYLTCYSGFYVPDKPGGTQADLKRHLLAIRRSDGKLIWEKVIPARLPEEDSIRDHGFAASSPAADADRVYVFFGKTGVLAFDHFGQQQWQADVGTRTHGWGTSASPVLFEDLVFINASVESDALIALDCHSGKERWRVKGIKEAWNSPVVVTSKSGSQELVIATQGKIMAFEPKTGRPLWTCATDITWYMVPSVVAQEGVVYCLGGRSGVAGLAVRAGGTGDVTRSHRLWTSQKGSNVTSPVVHGQHLYWMNDNRGTAYCAELATGNVVYEKRLERAGQVYASALLADGKIYYITREGRTYVVAAQPEFQLLATNDMKDGGLFNGSFAVDGQRLLIRSDHFLYCVGK